MVELSHGLGFAFEAISETRAGDRTFDRQHLNRDRPIKMELASLVDRAHPTTTDYLKDLVIWERRIEFRRQLKLFRHKLEEIDMFQIRHEMSDHKVLFGEQSDSSALSDNSDFLQSEGENIGTKAQEQINEAIKSKISKFYFYNE